MTHLYKYLIPDSSKNSTFILKNSANNSIFASIFDSILDSRSSNSISILQFSDSALTRLRLQSFDIRLDDEPRVGTPLRRYLLSISRRFKKNLTEKNPFTFSSKAMKTKANISRLSTPQNVIQEHLSIPKV